MALKNSIVKLIIIWDLSFIEQRKMKANKNQIPKMNMYSGGA